MTGTGIEIRGLARLQRTMDKAGASLEEMTAANQEAAAMVANAARGRAPRLTGRLAGSIAGYATPRNAIVTANMVYAGVTEWGWPQRNRPARHFLVPALQETKPQWLAGYKAEVQKTLDTVKGA
jgi:phage gpG-like protein